MFRPYGTLIIDPQIILQILSPAGTKKDNTDFYLQFVPLGTQYL